MSPVFNSALQTATESVEALLHRFLSAASDEDNELCRTRLIEMHLEPLIRKIVGRKLRTDPRRAGAQRDQRDEKADAIYIESLAAICQKLDQWRQGRASPPESLLDYVAKVAYHACNGAWSEQRSFDPLSEVSYLLTHRPGLALWRNGEHELLGGRAQWRDAAVPEASASAVRELLRDPLKFAQTGLQKQQPDRKPGKTSPFELFEALLVHAGAPIELNSLAAAYTGLSGDPKRAIREVTVSRSGKHGETERTIVEDLVDGSDLQQRTTDREERQSFLQRLWPCIMKLQFSRHRAVLLLNCEYDDIRLLPTARIASFNEIAAALELKPSELAHLWNRLPLDDDEIAERLGTTKSKVKEMRQAAYRNLAWQMRSFDRRALNRLWQAAIELEPARPTVFMLRARDAHGESLLALVNREEFADKEQIAARLHLAAADLDMVWKALPLDFGRIARLLHSSPQQMIQLYYDARARLKHCLAVIEREA